MPLQFKVGAFLVRTKAELNATFAPLGGLPELPRMDRPGPGPEFRATVVVLLLGMARVLTLGVDEAMASACASSRQQLRSTADYMDLLDNPEIQRKMQNNGDVVW
ncbi:hypothetical protein FOA52_012394 [Chlamydomonas sp. UWO 241]|nr:hypothetical protein FOA52_012394 [Chlamydomonas sp. UWO 241]